MIDLTKLNYHTAGYDSQGRAVLTPKPAPAGLADASPVSRLAYTHAAAREFEAVGAAARNAAMPPKPEGWEKLSSIELRTWQLNTQRRG